MSAHTTTFTEAVELDALCTDEETVMPNAVVIAIVLLIVLSEGVVAEERSSGPRWAPKVMGQSGLWPPSSTDKGTKPMGA